MMMNGFVIMMNENIIKAVAIPVASIAFLVGMRVMHKNPQLVSNLMSQASNAQSPIDRKSLELRANKCRNAIDITALSDKELNDLVWLCESKNKSGLEKP